MTGVLINMGNMDTDTRPRTRRCKDEGKDGGEASASQRCQDTTRNWGKAQNRVSLPAFEGPNPANTLILGLQPLGLGEEKRVWLRLWVLGALQS